MIHPTLFNPPLAPSRAILMVPSGIDIDCLNRWAFEHPCWHIRRILHVKDYWWVDLELSKDYRCPSLEFLPN
jgi:hypothetical protein